MDPDLKFLLESIVSKLDILNAGILSIHQSMSVQLERSTQAPLIRSFKSDLSDQIRSDQISKECSNLHEDFRQLCESLEIDISLKDISEQGRSITYYFENRKKILNPKSYIKKMLLDFPNKRKTSPAKAAVSDIRNDTESGNKSTLIMGVDASLVEDRIQYFDEHTFNQVFQGLSEQQKKMFPSYPAVMRNEMKRNIMVAIGINGGHL
jgi:hypothetical protein